MGYFHDPGLDIPTTTPDWPLDGRPALTWAPPATMPDHLVIWWNDFNDWSSATPLAKLPGATTTYTDPSQAAIDGGENYYWVIAYGAGNLTAGNNRGVMMCQNHVSPAGLTLNKQPDGSGASFSTHMPFATHNIAVNGTYRSTASVGAAAWVAGNPHPPNSGPQVYLQANLETIWTGPPATEQIQIIGDGSPSPCDISGGSGFSFQGEADGEPHPAGHLGHPTYDYRISEGGPGNNWGTPPPIPNPSGFFSSIASGVGGTAKLSYVSPAAHTNTGGIPGSEGGGVGTVPTTPAGVPIGLIPMPVPLPCIPCCATAAPICHCLPEWPEYV